MKGDIFMGLMNNKRLKFFAAGIAMLLTGCATTQTEDVATNEFKNESSVASSNPETTTNKRIPGVQVQFIDDDAYGDEDSVENDYVPDNVGYTLTTAPLESGTSVLLYTTTVGGDSKDDSGEKDFIVSRPQDGSKPAKTTAKPIVTTARTTAKPVVTTARTTAEPVVTTAKTTAKSVVTTVETTAAPAQPAPGSETQPVVQMPKAYSIDDICNDSFVLRDFAKKICDDLAVGNNGFFYINNREFFDYEVGLYLIAALNGDAIDKKTLAEALGGDDMSSFIDDSMYFLGFYSKVQKEYGFNINFSDYICTQRDPNGDYANYLNALQYYGSNNSILDFAAEHRYDYAGDLVATSLLYSYQMNLSNDDDYFMSYSEVIDASASFNNRLLDAVSNLSYTY